MSKGTLSRSRSGPVAPAAIAPKTYLDQEAQTAQIAMKRTWAELKATLTGADPRTAASANRSAKSLIGEHPYVALGTAIATGFLAGAIFVPSKEQQVLKKLAALERAVALNGGHGAHAKPGSSLAGTMIGLISSSVRPILLNLLTGIIAGKAAGEAVQPGDDAADFPPGRSGDVGGATSTEPL